MGGFLEFFREYTYRYRADSLYLQHPGRSEPDKADPPCESV